MNKALKATLSTFGVLAGISGSIHGIGEILQGNQKPSGLVFETWPDSVFFSNLSGEPAMTIIPNLLVSGILAVVFSLAFLVWAVAFVERRHTSLVMFGLSLAMLLVGSGFGPALLGIILAIGSRGFKKPNAPRASAKDKSKFQFLSKIWPWLFGACLLSWLFLFPASSALDYLFSIDSTNILFGAIPFAFLSLIALIIISTAKDSLSD